MNPRSFTLPSLLTFQGKTKIIELCLSFIKSSHFCPLQNVWVMHKVNRRRPVGTQPLFHWFWTETDENIYRASHDWKTKPCCSLLFIIWGASFKLLRPFYCILRYIIISLHDCTARNTREVVQYVVTNTTNAHSGSRASTALQLNDPLNLIIHNNLQSSRRSLWHPSGSDVNSARTSRAAAVVRTRGRNPAVPVW